MNQELEGKQSSFNSSQPCLGLLGLAFIIMGSAESPAPGWGQDWNPPWQASLQSIPGPALSTLVSWPTYSWPSLCLQSLLCFNLPPIDLAGYFPSLDSLLISNEQVPWQIDTCEFPPSNQGMPWAGTSTTSFLGLCSCSFRRIKWGGGGSK